jgi:hypothetical protein
VYPNAGVLTNWCYVFLFDMVWQGPIRYTRNASFICHNYSEKQYDKARADGIWDRLKTLARRLNVYSLYCAKTASKGQQLLLVAVPASVLGFARDIFSALWRVALRRILRRERV